MRVYDIFATHSQAFFQIVLRPVLQVVIALASILMRKKTLEYVAVTAADDDDGDSEEQDEREGFPAVQVAKDWATAWGRCPRGCGNRSTDRYAIDKLVEKMELFAADRLGALPDPASLMIGDDASAHIKPYLWREMDLAFEDASDDEDSTASTENEQATAAAPNEEEGTAGGGSGASGGGPGATGGGSVERALPSEAAESEEGSVTEYPSESVVRLSHFRFRFRWILNHRTLLMRCTPACRGTRKLA